MGTVGSDRIKTWNKHGGREALAVFALCVEAAAFLLLFSTSTSPLYGTEPLLDAGVFLTVGKYWALGDLPYLTLWDSKGPLIFFVNALGYLLTGSRTGVFLVQLVFLYVAAYLGYRMLRETVSRGVSLLLSALMLFGMALIFNYGNSVEEYALPFLFASFWLFVRWRRDAEHGVFAHKPAWAFVYGLCFGVCLMTRVVNAVGLCTGIAFICVRLMANKLWKNLLQNAGMFLLGAAAVVLPFCAYFAAHGALYEMWYGTVLYNFEYLGTVGVYTSVDSKPLYALCCMTAAAPFLSGLWTVLLTRARWRTGLFWMLVSGATCLWLCRSDYYLHYALIAAPYFCVAVCELVRVFRDTRGRRLVRVLTAAGLSAYLLILGWNAFACTRAAVSACVESAAAEPMEAYPILSAISKSERDSFIAYNCPTGLYLQTGLRPCYRYFVLQNWAGARGASLRPKIRETFAQGDAKWVLTDSTSEIDIQDILDARYEPVSTDGPYTLYHLTGE